MKPMEKELKVQLYSHMLGNHLYPVGQLSNLSLTKLDMLGFLHFGIQPNVKLETVGLIEVAISKVIQFMMDMR